jgi:hypothetical protein
MSTHPRQAFMNIAAVFRYSLRPGTHSFVKTPVCTDGTPIGYRCGPYEQIA